MDWSKTVAATRRGIAWVLLLVPLATLFQRWDRHVPWTEPIASAASIFGGFAASGLFVLVAIFFFRLWTLVAGEGGGPFGELKESTFRFGFCVVAAMSTGILVMTGR